MSLSQCFNTTDPISLDEIEEDDLVILEMDHKRNKGHCFSVESIADYIKSKIENGSKIIKNPVNPKYILSDADKTYIYNKMRMKNPDWDLPVYNKKYEKKSLFFSTPQEASLSSLDAPVRIGFGAQIAPASTLPNRIREANLSIRPNEQDDIELAEALSRITHESRNIQNSISHQGENRPSRLTSRLNEIRATPVSALSSFNRSSRHFPESATSSLAKKLAKEREDSFSNRNNQISASIQGGNSLESVLHPLQPIIEFETEGDGKVSWKEVYINPPLKQPGKRNKDLEKYKSKRTRKNTSIQQKQNTINFPISNQGENQIPKNTISETGKIISNQNNLNSVNAVNAVNAVNNTQPKNVVVKPFRFIKGENGFQVKIQGEKVLPIQEQFNILSSEVSKRWTMKQIIVASVVAICILVLCFWIRKRLNSRRFYKR